MKSVKSIASIASLALVINFSGLINEHSNVLKNYSVSYAHSYSERSSLRIDILSLNLSMIKVH